jgi:hypothetical protein
MVAYQTPFAARRSVPLIRDKFSPSSPSDLVLLDGAGPTGAEHVAQREHFDPADYSGSSSAWRSASRRWGGCWSGRPLVPAR